MKPFYRECLTIAQSVNVMGWNKTNGVKEGSREPGYSQVIWTHEEEGRKEIFQNYI